MTIEVLPAGRVAFTVTVKVTVTGVPDATAAVVVIVHKVPATEPAAHELVAPVIEVKVVFDGTTSLNV